MFRSIAYLEFLKNNSYLSKVVSTVKWLEDELELNALQNPVSRQGTANEKVVLAQRAALATALGGRVDISAMSTISGCISFDFNVYLILLALILKTQLKGHVFVLLYIDLQKINLSWFFMMCS